MKCCNHHDRDAFVVCKSCGKALCLECAEQYKGSYVCKGSKSCRHIALVDYVNYFKDNSEGAWMFNKIAFLLLGVLLFLYIFVKTFLFLAVPCPLLESVLLILLAILLIKKALDMKVK